MRPLALALVALLACDRGGDDKAAAPRGPRPFPVETSPVETRPIAFAIQAVGSVVAFEEIQVTSRVTGVVEKVRFSEGQAVKAGQVLAEIEPQRFQIAVRTAQAALERARATQNEAQAGLTRREEATRNNPGLIPGEEVEGWRTRVSTAGAEIAAARAALDRARLDLRDAYVKAPVAGVLETRTVQTGQFVQPGTVLATLVRRDPLLLKFDVPEAEAAGLAPGQKVSFAAAEGDAPYSATIKLVTTAADPVTRMVKVTAEVDDPRQAALRPGTFARVSVQLGESREAIAVPQAAVRPSEKGFLAYVVVDGKAVEKVVELGMHTPDGRVQVTRGLKVGELLVVRGAEALRDGVPVAPAGALPRAGKAAQ
ncbi:MAG TPA: efflux RND transporter periplasmic adaptor subunit [Kofleriaceae bacterium]|nr:efflux RND transporter periplasmic adaptor subunit [Kofleriaceae bacterium]